MPPLSPVVVVALFLFCRLTSAQLQSAETDDSSLLNLDDKGHAVFRRAWPFSANQWPGLMSKSKMSKTNVVRKSIPDDFMIAASSLRKSARADVEDYPAYRLKRFYSVLTPTERMRTMYFVSKMRTESSTASSPSSPASRRFHSMQNALDLSRFQPLFGNPSITGRTKQKSDVDIL